MPKSHNCHSEMEEKLLTPVFTLLLLANMAILTLISYIDVGFNKTVKVQ